MRTRRHLGPIVALLAVAACGTSEEQAKDATGTGTGSGATGSGVGPGGAGGTPSGAGAGATASSGSGGAQPLKVAFIGDSDYGAAFEAVLTLIKTEPDVALVLHQGDFDYALDPDGFFAVIDNVLGPDFPYLGSVGNHDAPAWTKYAAHFAARMQKLGITPDDPSLDDQMFTVHYLGLHIVFVGENGKNDAFAKHIADGFAGPPGAEWRIASWHKNQNAMQVGGKGDEMGWGVYENARAAGAILATAHEHSYQRTKTLTSMQDQTVDPTCSDPKELCVGPGRSFVFVSGLGGKSIRDQERCLPDTPPYGCKGEWASIYTSNQGAKYGALFILFNDGGDPKKARGWFTNVDGEVIDSFNVTRD
jgi:hypothetical protein